MALLWSSPTSQVLEARPRSTLHRPISGPESCVFSTTSIRDRDRRIEVANASPGGSIPPGFSFRATRQCRSVVVSTDHRQTAKFPISCNLLLRSERAGRCWAGAKPSLQGEPQLPNGLFTASNKILCNRGCKPKSASSTHTYPEILRLHYNFYP